MLTRVPFRVFHPVVQILRRNSRTVSFCSLYLSFVSHESLHRDFLSSRFSLLYVFIENIHWFWRWIRIFFKNDTLFLVSKKSISQVKWDNSFWYLSHKWNKFHIKLQNFWIFCPLHFLCFGFLFFFFEHVSQKKKKPATFDIFTVWSNNL